MSAAKTVQPMIRDPDQTRPIEELIRDVLPNILDYPEVWMNTPNPKFEYATPAEAIKKEKRWEDLLRNIILSAKYGFFS